jgi:hypothetical protein
MAGHFQMVIMGRGDAGVDFLKCARGYGEYGSRKLAGQATACFRRCREDEEQARKATDRVGFSNGSRRGKASRGALRV